MGKINSFFKNTAKNLAATFARFPLTLFALASLTCILIYISASSTDKHIYSSLIAAFASAASASAAGVLFSERGGGEKGRLAISSVCAAAGFAAGFFLTYADPVASRFLHCYIAFNAVLLLLLYIIPVISGRAAAGGVFMAYVKAAAVAGFYSIVVFAGLWFVLFATDALLFAVDDNFTNYLLSFSFVFFMGLAFLSHLPHFTSEDDVRREKNFNCPKFLEILVSYILIPIIAAVTLIFAVYFIKILVTLTWPQNEVAQMMAAYGAAGIVLWYLTLSARNRFNIVFRKYFPYALIFSAILGVVSAVIRINAYGITFDRYVICALFALMLVCAICFIIFRENNGFLPPAAAALFILLTVSPFLGAQDVSFYSQSARFEALLEQNGMLKDGSIIPSPKLDAADKMKIAQFLAYFNSTDDSLKRISFLPDNFILEKTEPLFGFPAIEYPDLSEKFNLYYRRDSSATVILAGFDEMRELNLEIGSEPYSFAGMIFSSEKDETQGDILLIVDNGKYKFSLRDFCNDAQNAAPADFPIDFSAGEVKYRIIIKFLNTYAYDSNSTRISAEVIVLSTAD